MTRFGVGLASALLCVALTVPAQAPAAGNGLYEPFPTVAARKRAKRFVNELRAAQAQRPVSDAELDDGAFAGPGLQPVAAGAASGRATSSGGPSAPSAWLVMGALLAALAAPALRRE